MEQKNMRIGIFGTMRGEVFIDIFQKIPGARVTAICDFSELSLRHAQKHIDADPTIRVFNNFDDFIDSGLMDAVMICNYFNEHAPYAIRAMKRGIHVLTECTPAITMAECVELCRTAEKTGCKYMLAENYPFFACNMEMKRRFDTGALGRVLYCEGEYNHPNTPKGRNLASRNCLHWRQWNPRAYYLTHALAPILYMTGNELKAVNCKCVFDPEPLRGTAYQVGDLLAIILCEMQDGSLARVTGCSAWGGHGNWYRICGERGNMENVRGTDNQVRIQYNGWHIPDGQSEVQVVNAIWDEDDAMNQLARHAGHGGGDFWCSYHFTRYINEDVVPFFDVYRSVSLSAAAILAHRSALEGGREYRIPNFRDEAERKLWEHDTLHPFPDENGNTAMPCCSHPDYHPTEEDLANAEKDWREAGYIR